MTAPLERGASPLDRRGDSGLGQECGARAETENRGEATINWLGTQQFVLAKSSRSAAVDDGVSAWGTLTARTGRDALARDSLKLHRHQRGRRIAITQQMLLKTEMQRSMQPAWDATINLLDEDNEDVATQQSEITKWPGTQQFILVAKGRRGIKRCQTGMRRGGDHKSEMKRTAPWHPPLPS